MHPYTLSDQVLKLCCEQDFSISAAARLMILTMRKTPFRARKACTMPKYIKQIDKMFGLLIIHQ